MAKEKRKYHKDQGRTNTKYKNFILSDGTKCKMTAISHKNKNGKLRCSNVFADWYISGFNFKEHFNLGTWEDGSRKIDLHFDKIKKKIEQSNNDIIIVFNYGISTTLSTNNGVFINLALHIEEMEFNTSTLDQQTGLKLLIEKITEEVKNSFK